MSIFNEMWPGRTFGTTRDYAELLRMLGEAIDRGYVEEIPTTLAGKLSVREKWFREKETGTIYSLTEPDERGPYWRPVEMEELVKEGETIQ
jgi:hypothetical protein